MSFVIQYSQLVVKQDIPGLSRDMCVRIKKAIEGKLVASPEIFGKPLRRSLKGYRKLRVGDYRIVFRIEGNIVKVFAILHRSVVYKSLDSRF